jgi:hypothetical protein
MHQEEPRRNSRGTWQHDRNGVRESIVTDLDAGTGRIHIDRPAPEMLHHIGENALILKGKCVDLHLYAFR